MPRTQEDLARIRGDLRSGVQSVDQLAPADALAIDVGRGVVGYDQLNPAGQTLLREHYPFLAPAPTMMERATGVVQQGADLVGGMMRPGLEATGRAWAGAAPVATEISESASRLPKFFTEGLPAAGRAFMAEQEGDTLGQRLIQRGTQPEPVLGGPPRLPSFMDKALASAPLPGALDAGERLLRVLTGLTRGAATLGPEQAQPLTQALAGGMIDTALSGGRPLRALATDVRGLATKPRVSTARLPSALPDAAPPFPMLEHAAPIGPQQLAIGPGSNLGEVVPRAFQRSGPALSSGKVPKALSAGPPQPKAIEAGSNRGVVVPKDAQYPGPDQPVGPPPPIPGVSKQPALTAGPPKMPAELLDQQGQPVFPPSVAHGVKPPPAPKVPREQPPDYSLDRTIREASDLDPTLDIDELSRTVHRLGGILPEGDAASLPPTLKNKTGRSLASMAEVLSEQVGREINEGELLSMLMSRGSGRGHLQRRKAERARMLSREFDDLPEVPEGSLPGTQPAGPPSLALADEAIPPIPEDIAHMVKEPEWATMTPQSRTSLVEWVRAEGAGVETGRLNVSGSVEPPAAPKFEKTVQGDQALIPGAESRAIPQTRTKPPGGQKPIDDTPLFGQEKRAADEASDAAQGDLPGEEPPTGGTPRLRTFIPPIPLPGPEEGQEDTPEGQAQRLAQVAGIALPLAMAILGRGRLRPGAKKSTPPEVPPTMGAQRVGNAPPEVPPAFRREEVGPPRLAAAAERFREGAAKAEQQVAQVEQLARQPLSAEQVRAQAQEVIQQAKTSAPDLGGGGGGFSGPPGAGMNLPADVPSSPMPEASRAARFFEGSKALFSYLNVPEDVVRGNPAGTAVVRLTYRRYDDGKMMVREFDDALGQIVGRTSDADLEKIKKVMDTNMPAVDQVLPPELAATAKGIRAHLDRLADAVGLPGSGRIESYFPRMRDTVKVEETRLVLDPTGVPYMSQTFMSDVGKPSRWEAFFLRERTATDQAGMPARDALKVYNRATARHLTMNGGIHPFTGEAMAGYLNELQPLLGQQSEAFKPYLGQFVNYFLGNYRPGTELGHQLSRTARNLEFARLIGGNLGSPIANLIQQTNTAALVSPTSFLRGYMDILDPARRALAQRFVGLEELAKADLDAVQKSVGSMTRLDRAENLSSRMAEMSGTLFRLSETQGNRYHAFLAGLREAEGIGLQGRPAIEFARDVVEHTQFANAGPAKAAFARGPIGSALGQFKSFQMRQTQFVKNLVADDIKDLMAAYGGQREVPIEIMGRRYHKPDGTPATRPLGAHGTRFIPMRRTVKWMMAAGAVGGPDAVFPGFDAYLEEQGIKVPSLARALGIGIGSLMNYGVIQPGDVTRSLLFFLPGPMIGHAQDAASVVTGVNWGHGLTEMVRGDMFTPLTWDQWAAAAARLIPVGGITAARGLEALKTARGGRERREAQTLFEALGIDRPSGDVMRRPESGEAAKRVLGLPSATSERRREASQDLGTLAKQANHALNRAASLQAAGKAVLANRLLRQEERRLGLPFGSLEVSPQGEAAAELRRQYTPLERQQHELRNRFPREVEKSRRQTGGQQPPDSNGLRGIGLPRLR